MKRARSEAKFERPSHNRLNAILIMCDQLPYNALGCTGHPLEKTPNIDSLAAGGTSFSNAFAQSTVCVPSRACQLTGLYPSNHGILDNVFNLEIMHPRARMLTDSFYDQGYATAHFGKWHCGKPHTQCKWTEFKFLEESVAIWPQTELERFKNAGPTFLTSNGIVDAATHPLSKENTGPARITDYGIDFLERFAYQPFFLRLSYLGPHSPVLVPKPFDTMYSPEQIQLPAYGDEEMANRPKSVRAFQRSCIEGVRKNNCGMPSGQALRTHIAYSLGLISHIDDQIGRILQALDTLGLRENTVVVFTTDHGAFWGEHGMVQKSCATHYRSLLNIPLIMTCPGHIPPGKTVEGFIEEVDILPTLMDIAGIEHPYKINGQSARKALQGDVSVCRQDVFAETMISPGGYAVASLRDNRWHFIWHAATGETELYDMRNDLHERFNCAGDAGNTAVIEECKGRLLSRMMNGRNVHLIPDSPHLNRSPIYLAPGYDEKTHQRAMIDFYFGARSDEFPRAKA